MIRKNLLKILFVEDLVSDAELAVLELRKEKLKFEHTTVCTRVDLIKALKEFKPDLIISDYKMPSFNGLQAMEAAKEIDSEIPFILCTGSVNEETAVECIKAGAQDYVIKEHMTRLPFAVKEALEQVLIQKEKRASELLLKESEEKIQSIFSAAPVGIGLVIKRKYFEVNDTFCRMTGYSRNEIIGKSSAMMYPTKEEFEIAGDKKYKQIANSGIGSVETRLKRKDGKIINIISTSAPLDPEDLSKGVTFTVLDITERIRAEEELIQEKYLVYSLMDTLTDHIYFKDRSSRFIRINKALAKFFGLNDPIQAAGKTDSDFFTGEHSKQAYEDEQSIIRTGKQLSIEERETHLNRPDTWASTVKLPLRDKDGNIIGTFGISRDITGRKLAEEALKESQHLFQTLSQVSPVGIFRTKPGGYTTYVNPKYLELSGLTSEEAIGYGWLKAVHPDDREQLNGGWQSDVQSQISSIAEYRFLRSDGSVVWVMGNAVPEWIDNEIIGYIGTITDITERKLTEEALAESETKYRQLVMQSPDGIFIVDLSGKFLSANRAIFDNLKYSEEELLSMKIWDIVPEQYHSLHKKRLMTILNGENTSSNAEYEVIGKDEVSHFIEVMSSPYYKGKEIIGFQGIARDITERNRAEKALRESEEKYRIIFENVQDLYYETSIDGTIIEVSPSIKVLSKDQYSREDLIGKSIYDFYSDSDERAAIISLLKERGTVSDFEVTMKNKDGSTVPCSASAKIFTDALGHPEKIIGSMHDITDRKNASDALRLAKEKAEASFRDPRAI